jgi:hypothetical protein
VNAPSSAAFAPAPTLAASGARALSLQAALLLLAAYALPAAMHALGWPVRMLLPMHWPVLLAGLVYGWRSGAMIGASAPAVSFALSGWPRPAVLPAMVLELALYGLIAGYLRERLRWSGFAAIALALVAGRAVFLLVAIATGWTGPDLPAYLGAALVPGFAGALLQCLLLPGLAAWWVRRAG